MNELVLNKSKSNFFVDILKGVLFATSISLVAILLFALLHKIVSIPESVIAPVNQVIKIVSIYFGVRTSLKINSNKAIIKGLLVAIFYTILTFLIFSLISKSFEFNMSVINDIIFGSVLGLISAVLINLLRK